MKLLGALVVGVVLSSVAGAGRAAAQPGPIYLKTVDILTGGDLTGVAYDGTYYYLAMREVRCWVWRCGVYCSYRFCNGGVEVRGADGTYVRTLEDGGDYRHHGNRTHGVAVKGTQVWSMTDPALYKHNAATGSVVQRSLERLELSPGRLAHDGRTLWGVLYRLDPNNMKLTGTSPAGLDDECGLMELAPDGLGGLWFRGTAEACRGQVRRYQLAEPAPGVLEAAFVESYDGFGDFSAFTTNTSNPFELVLLKPHPTRAHAFVAEHYLMPPYEPPNYLASLTPSSATVSGCLKASATVGLTGPAPVVGGGVTVGLRSDNPNVVVPAALRFEPGEGTQSFPIVTRPVANQEIATITATIPGHSLSATLTLKPMGPKAVSFAPNPVIGGSAARGTLVLECAAGPGDLSVTLTSATPEVAAVVNPAVTVPAGATVLPIEVTTAPVTRATRVVITATANGVTKSKALVVNPAP